MNAERMEAKFEVPEFGEWFGQRSRPFREMYAARMPPDDSSTTIRLLVAAIIGTFSVVFIVMVTK